MDKISLTIFANIRINNEERFQRMKDSFKSIKNMNAQKWVINVRGEFQYQTILFLRNELGDKLVSFCLDSQNGWFHDTRKMFGCIESDYVFCWIEDHINMIDPILYDNLLLQMVENNVDSLKYTWFCDGYLDKFKGIDYIQTKDLKIYTLDTKSVKQMVKNFNSHERYRKWQPPIAEQHLYIVSYASFFSLSFFEKLIFSIHPIPRRWPKETPFDIEKRITDEIFLPIVYAIPNYELFACIDDNNTCDDGYNLIDRGLYKNRITRSQLKKMEYKS